ncbi:MAG: CidA/LrgA family protein [Candidatus Faecousia sp.]|nr:CidA/LrgA family protein [Candidatus Faecousia sp.]
MKYLKQFSIILAISCLGELLSCWIPAPIPGSIYGIVLLFLGLVTKVIPIQAVKETGHFLVEIMPVMFIPAAAGVLESWELIASSWLQYGLLTIVTTVAVMGVAGWVTQLFTGKGEKKHG